MIRALTHSALIVTAGVLFASGVAAQGYGNGGNGDYGSSNPNFGTSDYSSGSQIGLKKDYGILLLAHGGGTEWNNSIEDVRKAVAAKKIPIEIAFGMADPLEMQAAVDRLAAVPVKKIIVVPLFISSHSEVIDQTMYVLGMRATPSEEFMNAPHAHMMHVTIKRVQTKIPIVLTQALDDHPIVAQILVDRAKSLSRNPSNEFVLLIGHGPLRDVDNEVWINTMDHLGTIVQKQGGFKGAFSATLRDDSPDDVKQKADKIMRDLVLRLSKKGRVLVVPYLISSGGIERHVQDALNGTFYQWNGKTLLPDPRISQWVLETAEKSSDRPNMRKFNDAGKPLPEPERKHLVPMESTSSGRSNGY